MDNSIEFWNKIAGKKEFTTEFDYLLFSKYVNKNSAVLDFGCGYGRILSELQNIGYTNLYGIDASDKMVEIAKTNLPDSDITSFNGLKTNFTKNSFDCVLLMGVLTCVYDEKKQDLILNEIKRVLKPSGIIYIADFKINTDKRNIERYKCFESKYNKYGVFELDNGKVFCHHSEKRINEVKTFFREIYYKELIFKTMNDNISNGFIFLGENI